MKTYWAIVRQNNGCDYTIGCGISAYEISAKTIEEAIEHIVDDWADGYQTNKDEHCVDEVELLEVTKVINMHDALLLAQEMFQKKSKMREEEKKVQAEKAEYERLKEKFKDE